MIQEETQYEVSARKYRPKDFESLIGQDNIAKTLRNSILRGQLAHAYLFCGPRGVGKTTTARIFAKMINCFNPGEDMSPCGVCESCLSFAEGRSFCIHELDAASNNGVDDIKVLIDQVRIPPQVGKYSVYIIDEVHMLSQAAFNAFLKTLEEPPAHAIFILATTEKHKILPTILSRCQTYDFKRISVPDIVANLRNVASQEGVEIDEDSLHIIAAKADGAMRDALTLFDQTVAFCGKKVQYEEVLRNLNVMGYEHCFELVDFFLKGDYAASLARFDFLLSKGFNAQHFISSLSSHFRDLMVCKAGSVDGLLELSDSMKARYRAQAEACDLKFLYDALAITTQCEAGYKASINPRLHIEFALMRLCFLLNAPATTLARPAVQPKPAAPVVSAPAPAQASPTAPAQAPPTAPAQAAPPAAAPAASKVTPAESPSPTGRRRRTAGVSMMDLTKAEVENNPINMETEQLVAPTPEKINKAWLAVATSYSETQVRLSACLLAAQFESEYREKELHLTIRVQNAAQVSWIREKKLRELTQGMIQQLYYTPVILHIDVQEQAQVLNAAYSPEEQLKKMNEENPEVQNVISAFGAVIK